MSYLLSQLIAMGLKAQVFDEDTIEVVMHPDAQVTVGVRNDNGMLKYYVSYHHNNGNLMCFEGTHLLDLVMYQLGMVKEAINNILL